MLLENKNAVIYGAGGGLGGGVARTFAREGANFFLAGRTREKLDAVAADIAAAGGSAEVAVLDALDEHAVDEHVREVVSRAGSIDVSFNLTSREDKQGTPLIEMSDEDATRATITALTRRRRPLGRETYDTSVPWWGADGPAGSARRPVFVVTHEAPADAPPASTHS